MTSRLVDHRFVCERLAGSGGMGHVWRALDRQTGQPVALKLLRGEARELADRFMREARLLARLEHPAVVRHVAHGQDQGELYLAMEWLEGEDLAARLQRGKLAPEEASSLVRRLLEALQAAHAIGAIHRDLKPANVFLPAGDPGQAKLLDFGVARLQSASLATRAGAIIGTPAYMSPEQARGDADVDARSDLFALACVWLECLSGRPAFAGQHVVMVLAKVLFEEPADLAEVDPATRAVLARLLAKARGDRPASAAAVLAELGSTPRPRPTPSPSDAGQLLGRAELRRFFLVVAAPPPAALLDTSTPPQVDAADEQVRRIAADTDVRLERLVDGTWVGAASVGLGASDAAARVARSALTLARLLPGARVSAATGRGVAHGRVPAGEVIDRAALLVGEAVPGAGVRIDDGMAGLLDARFELIVDGGFVLVRERPSDDGVRSLLGRPSPCVGRERELGILRGTIAACEADRAARVVLVTAPPGVGKSRLRRELATQLAADGRPLLTWLARGDALGSGSPLGLLAQLVRAAAGIDGDERPEVARKKLLVRARRHLPAEEAARVAVFLAEILGGDAPDDTHPGLAAARRDAPLLAEQVQRAWEDLVVAECSAQPVLVVVEDLHWGDAASVRHLQAALARAAELPLCVLALARPEVHERFPGLWREVGLEELHLPQLPRRAAERLVRHALPAASDDDVARLVGLAAGNSFYLEELVRALASGKRELPESVLAMAQGRYEALGEETRRILRAASLLGESFWSGALAALLGAEVATRLPALVDQELIERRARSRHAGQDEYQFRHALLREAAYAALPDEERRLGHRLAGAWLERIGEPGAMILAEHAERAGDGELAARHLARAAEQALEVGDLDGALVLVGRARALGSDAVGLDLSELEAWKWKGERDRQTQAAARVLARAAPGSVSWCRAFVDAVPPLHDLPGREATLAAVVPEAGAEADFAVCLARLLTQCCIGLREAHIGPLVERLERLAEGDLSLTGWVHQVRGFRAAVRGDLATRHDELRAAAAAFERVGDERNALAQFSEVGEMLRELGYFADSVSLLRRVVSRCEALGLARLAGFARFNLAWSLCHVGSAAEVSEVLAEARFVNASPSWQAWGEYAVASAYLVLGDLRAAEEHARAADAVNPAGREIIFCAPLLADLELRRGRPAEALAILDARPIRPTVLTDSEVWGRCQRVRAEALIALGRLPEAGAHLAETLRGLSVIAAAISVPERHAALIERLPEYRRIAELARQLGVG